MDGGAPAASASPWLPDDPTAEWVWQSLAPDAGEKGEEQATDGESAGDAASEAKERADAHGAKPSPALPLPPPPVEPKVTTDEQRRQRHNANERRRTNALKTRILRMREELAALEAERDRLQAATANGGGGGGGGSGGGGDDGAAVPDAFLATVRSIDQLRVEQQQLRLKLRAFDMQNSTYQTVLTEFGATPESRQLAAGARARRPLPRGASPDAAGDKGEGESETASDEGLGELDAEDAPIFQRVLFPRPMALPDVMACVRQFYEEIMRFRAEREFESLSSEVLGWRDRRILDATSLRFMLSQHFALVPAEELVYKTWNLLTTLALYRRIQPRTVALRLLQRVTDDCVIVRLSVGGNGTSVHSSILLIARGRIDGGYLITYRSIPLTPAQREFARGEGDYVHLNNWYMFLDGVSPRGEPACEVTLGGAVANQSAEYLRYLMMEVVAGVVRWQTAVGHSRFWLTD